MKQTNGHAQDGDALSQKEWQQALHKHQQSRVEKKAPPRISAPQIKSMDVIIDSRVNGALRSFTVVFAKKEAERVHRALNQAAAKMRDEFAELRAGLLKDLGEIISAEAALNRDADRRNTLAIVSAITAPKQIVRDDSGNILGVEVVGND
jgi:hypothetical protein